MGMINTKLTILLLMTSTILLLLPLQYGSAVITPGLTNKERYDTGYSWGCSDARKSYTAKNGKVILPYLDNHPTHTKIFMDGYRKGFNDCSFSGSAPAPIPAPAPNIKQKQGNKIVINWLKVCRSLDFFISEPCNTLTSKDGLTLTAEGDRVLRCIAGGGLLLLLDPTGQTLAKAQALGPAVGCKPFSIGK